MTTMSLQLQATQQPQTHAAKQNARYSDTKSMYFDIKDRFNAIVSGLPLIKQTGVRSSILNACQKFQKLFPNAKTFTDFDIVEAIQIPLSDILIDATIQRLLNLAWVCAIVANFRDVQAMPIQVYPVTDKNVKYTAHGPRGLYASWDGQHTLAAFYVIFVLILRMDPKDVMIPVNVYKVSKKSEIRENFVKGNGPEGKKLLDAVDYYMQMIYGVRVDGSTNPTWVEAEIKQQYLEQADLFVTAEKFGDTQMAGAISRMQEINGYSSDIIRKFALYTTTFPVARPVASQEIEIMCAWFDMAKKDGVDLKEKVVGFRGDYYELADHAKHKVKHLIYPVPNPEFPFLGVHFTRMTDGSIECGPNAVFTFKREGYGKTDFSLRDTIDALSYIGTWRLFMGNMKYGLDEYRRAFSKRLFLKTLQRLIPDLTMEDIVPGRAGVRALLLREDGDTRDDFRIEYTDHSIHVLNAPSPAATASLAIGDNIVEMAVKHFGLI
jgi:hypothetical protein